MMAQEILDLASDGIGLFWLINREDHGIGIDNELKSNDPTADDPASREIRKFWEIEPSIRECFTRLVTIEAVSSLQALKNGPASKDFYPRWIILLFRTISASGAAGLW